MRRRPRTSSKTPPPVAASEFSLFHRIKLSLVVISLALLLEAALIGLAPVSVFYILDRAIPLKDENQLYLVAGALAAGAAIALLAGYVRAALASRALGRSLAALRFAMFERLQYVVPSPPRDASSRDLLSRFSTDFTTLETAGSAIIPRLLLPALEALICAALMMFADWRVGLVAIVFSPWMILAPMLSAARAARSLPAPGDDEKSLLRLVHVSLNAQAIIRAFGLEQMGMAAFRKRSGALSLLAFRARFSTALMERIIATGTLSIRFAIVAFSAWLLMNGTMTAGAFAALQLLALTLGNTLHAASDSIPLLHSASAALERIRGLLHAPRAVEDAPGARFLPAIHSEIGFTDVHFSYGEGERELLAGVTARIPRGAYIAFAGPSGSGKSSILKLLLRFYDPSAGRITIDGHDLKSLSQASLRARIGFVLQENWLFNVSVRENIRVGRPDASEEALVNAARATGLHDIIMELAHGYDSLAGEKGVRFTAAGMQRLAIARALIRDPEILLLDEATSALDPADEAAVGETLKTLRKGRTVIAVTHRLSTVADADHIFFVDRGTIVEQGSHFELMAGNGLYAGYWRKQAGFTFSSDGGHVDVDAGRLKSFPILESLDDDALAELAPCFATETFPPRREIVRQNDSGDKFYIIARGQVEVWRTEEQSGSTKEMAILQDGDFFGEITLLTGFPRTATVRALTFCTCISLERVHFNRLLARFPELQRKMSEVAVQRLRESSKQERQSLEAEDELRRPQ